MMRAAALLSFSFVRLAGIAACSTCAVLLEHACCALSDIGLEAHLASMPPCSDNQQPRALVQALHATRPSPSDQAAKPSLLAQSHMHDLLLCFVT